MFGLCAELVEGTRTIYGVTGLWRPGLMSEANWKVKDLEEDVSLFKGAQDHPDWFLL